MAETFPSQLTTTEGQPFRPVCDEEEDKEEISLGEDPSGWKGTQLCSQGRKDRQADGHDRM